MKHEEGRTYRVFHTLWYMNRNAGIFITDLQIDEGIPYLVFQWCENHDGEFPEYRHPIHPQILKPASCDAHDLMIEAPVEIPENPVLSRLIQEAKSRR